MSDARPLPERLGLAGNRLVALLLALGVALLFVALIAATYTFSQNAAATRLVEHTLRAEAAINRMAALNEQVETARRGYLIGAGASFRAIAEQTELRLGSTLREVSGLLSDNPRQTARLEEIVSLDTERKGRLGNLFRSEAVRREMSTGQLDREQMVLAARRIRAVAAEMAEEENALLSRRNAGQYRSLVQLYVVGGAAVLLLLLVLGTVILLIGRYNRSLSAAQDALRLVNEGLEEAVAARTAELSRANEEIQRFAYIVSHDLRSPLVNVLGFTAELDEARKVIRKFLSETFERQPELQDDAVWLAVEEDLPEALGFIRGSTEKMDRLIVSILQLSRQGRRPLSPEALPMDKVAAGVVNALHQRAAEAGAQVSVGPMPPLESDRLAIEQILSNLIENAIKYLSPDRPGEIAVEGRQDGSRVQIDVVDNGRGIDAKDHQRIFDLFRRSGQQDQPGEGIGLANVRALAYRLGGNIQVESELDRGSRFRLTLPATFQATEPST